MKFDFIVKNCSDVGLIVKRGNSKNTVFFWDENDDAAAYNIEIYRINWQYKNEGFFEKASILERRVDLYDKYEIDKYLSTDMPAYNLKQFVSVKEEKQGYYNILRSEVLYHKFTEAKPVCTINVERNKFYHSINDLPCGDYIVVLKIENRQGETAAQSMPYYFRVEDSEQAADTRARKIVRAVDRIG